MGRCVAAHVRSGGGYAPATCAMSMGDAGQHQGRRLALWLVARSKWIEQHKLHVMRWALRRWTDLEAYDFVELLELAGGYRVRRIGVDPGD